MKKNVIAKETRRKDSKSSLRYRSVRKEKNVVAILYLLVEGTIYIEV